MATNLTLPDVANALTPQVYDQIALPPSLGTIRTLQEHFRSGPRLSTFMPRDLIIQTLGQLEALPRELLLQIFSDFDLNTLASFRLVNREAADFVDSLPEYRTIMRLAPIVVGGSNLVDIHNGPSYREVHDKLFTTRCEQCDEIGSYLYLLTGARLCYFCIATDDRWLPIERAEAIQRFGLTEKVADKLPSTRELQVDHPTSLFLRTSLDRKSAYDAGIALHGSVEGMRRYVAEQIVQQRDSSRFYAPMIPTAHEALIQSTMARIVYNIHSTSPSPYPPLYVGQQQTNHQHLGPQFIARTSSVVRVKPRDRTTQQRIDTRRCVGCNSFSWREFHWCNEYDRTTFERHLRSNLQNTGPAWSTHFYNIIHIARALIP